MALRKMFKLFALIILITTVLSDASADSNELRDDVSNNSRQKRLLFYDEEGNLVKTYNNPYRYDYAQNAEKIQIPLAGKFFNPFLPFLKSSPFGVGVVPTAYMIPVSDEVIQQINRDPIYQNKLLTIQRQDMVIEPNPQCNGKRTQIPTDNCRNFLNCWDGWAYEQECPEGLMFAKEGYCDYPHNVDCSKRIKDVEDTSSTSASPQCNTEFETWRNEQQCSEFFVCVDRAPVKFKCPADLAYSQSLGVCDYRYRVDCNTPTVAMDVPVNQPNPTKCTSTPTADKEPAISASPTSGLEIASAGSGGESALNVPEEGKRIVTSSVVNSQSWTSTHVAMSRQDAIRQLKLGGIANVVAA